MKAIIFALVLGVWGSLSYLHYMWAVLILGFFIGLWIARTVK